MLKIPIHAHGFSTSTYIPMECLNIDFIGPFPDGGYVLVIFDTFTRWVCGMDKDITFWLCHSGV
jgi:hypothetical protein